MIESVIELNSPEQRQVYLGRTCGQDTALRAEVEQLVEAYEKSGGFLAVTTTEEKVTSPDSP